MRERWLLVVAALFVGGFVLNMVTRDETVANAIVQLAIAGTCVAGFAFVRSERRARAELGQFIAANVDAIRAGTASYRDQRLTYLTRVRAYPVVLSFLLATFRLHSRLVIVGRASRGVALACGAVTFVFGWWGIPWGPIWTAKALSTIARGGEEFTIGELIEGRSPFELPRASVR